MNVVNVAVVGYSTEEAATWCELLKASGYRVNRFSQPERFVKTLRYDTFDLILLDWELQKPSGADILARIRQGLGLDTPILVITALGDQVQLHELMGMGADDFLVKPVRPAELLGRVSAVLLRRGNQVVQLGEERYGRYLFNPLFSNVQCGEHAIALTPKELALSLLLFRNLDKALSRSHIQMIVWGQDGDLVSTRTMDAHLSRLRSKLGLNKPESEFQLMPIYNFGYRLARLSHQEVSLAS